MNEKYLKSVILLSLVCLVYQGISNSDIGIISELTHQYGNNWAGPVSNSLLLVGCGLTSLYHKYIGKFQFRFCLFVGSLGFTLYICSGLIFMKFGFTIAIEITILFMSLVAGMFSSVFYNSQFNLINTYAKIDDR